MRRLASARSLVALVVLLMSSLLLVHATSVSRAQTDTATTLSGAIGGADYRIEVPAAWNGTLVLYSHGYVAAGQSNPARDAPDSATAGWLLDHGYALAGSSYSSTGWALEDAFRDQIALLNAFEQQVGMPARTIAWGDSLGGIITAGLIQRNPERFTAALPMCGVLAGGVAVWNAGLDSQFVVKTLLAPDANLQLANITDPAGNLQRVSQALDAAQATPEGRARIALSAAVNDLPGWFDPTTSEPAPGDYTAQEQAQYLWEKNVDFPFVFSLRAELEHRAGGNPSWNTGVDYRQQLARSSKRAEVVALYQQAGLSLDQDLDTLNQAPRVAADPAAVDYLRRYIVFNGDISVPVLTLHTTGDGLVLPEDEQSYYAVVSAAGNADLLRQIFIDRAGHCSFTPAERIAAFQTLVRRLDTGSWDGVYDAASLNAAAAHLGPDLNLLYPADRRIATAPGFITYRPAIFPRPFDSRSPLPYSGSGK